MFSVNINAELLANKSAIFSVNRNAELLANRNTQFLAKKTYIVHLLGLSPKRKHNLCYNQLNKENMNYYHSKIIMYHEIHRMQREGFSISYIANYLGLNWRTTKRLLLLTEIEFEQELEKTRDRKKILDPYTEFVKAKLVEFNDTSAAQMHDWLKEHHTDFPKVSPKTVFNFVHWVRITFNIPMEKPSRDYMMVQECSYGQQAQVDFGFYNMRTSLGKTKKVQFFTMVLSRSRYKYVEFRDEPFTCEAVIEAHENAFDFFKGIPIEIVYDQDRLFMVDENYGELILTKEFKSYERFRQFKLYFCRKADPESKGKVENVVKYVKRNFLYNRSFLDLSVLNDEALSWLHRTANENIHGSTKKSPKIEFQIEQNYLRPWYALERVKVGNLPEYTVHKDNKISYKSNFYSVPIGTYKGKTTTVLVKSEGEFLILFDKNKNEICRHVISALTGQKIILQNHLRDTSDSINKLIEKTSELFVDTECAKNWLIKVKKNNPRYIRDQITLIKKVMVGSDEDIITQALDYVTQNNILLASDFKALVEMFTRNKNVPVNIIPIVSPINPLNGQIIDISCTIVEQSDIRDYDQYF